VRRHQSQHGLSLVELLIALAITASVMFPLVQMQATAASGAAIVRSQLEVQREADFALERIAARVRMTPPAELAPNGTTDTSGNWFGTVTFLRAGTRLLERSNGVDHELAASVTDFRITSLQSAETRPLVLVSLTVANAGKAVTAEATVRMGSAL
jgi:prepilin-type N-terminal cleavage/methylation domain-containing protein